MGSDIISSNRTFFPESQVDSRETQQSLSVHDVNCGYGAILGSTKTACINFLLNPSQGNLCELEGRLQILAEGGTSPLLIQAAGRWTFKTERCDRRQLPHSLRKHSFHPNSFVWLCVGELQASSARWDLIVIRVDLQ